MKKYRSLRIRVIGMVAATSLTISMILLVFNFFSTKKLVRQMYERDIIEVTKTVSSMLDTNELQDIVNHLTDSDPAKVKAYRKKLGTNQVYQKQLSKLLEIKKINSVKFLYIQKINPKKNSSVVIFDADTDQDTNNFIPGETYPLDEGESEENIPFETNSKEFGALMTVSSPIYDKNHQAVASISADISLQDIYDTLYSSFIWAVIRVLAIMVLLIILLYLFLNRSIVRPINLISKATRKFVQNLYLKEDGEAFEVENLEIHSKDELGRLSYDIQIMQEEINEYIVNLTRVTKEKERIGTELNVATQIQSDMLPKIFPFEPERGEFDLHALMRPAKEVGGDFYDFFMLDESHVAIVIGDVSDKGVPAALFMVISKTLIKDYTQAGMTVDNVFTHANNELCEGNDASLFTTGILGIFDINTGKLLYADAGHEPLIVMNTNEQTVRYVEPEKRNFVLGGMEDTKYVVNELTLSPGDVLLLYTDGVPDAMNMDEEAFGWDRLTETCQKHLNEEPHEMLKNILADLDEHIGRRAQFDDITMLALKVVRKGGASA